MNLIFALVITFSALAHDWSQTRAVIKNGLKQKTLPGAVLLIGTKSEVLFHEAFGKVDGGLTVNSTNTIYDLASLTKVVATATSVMILEERGQIRLDDKFVSYFPEFTGASKNLVTIEDLLRHQSGLPAGINLISGETHENFITRISKLPLQIEPRKKTIYSDLGFILLGELVKKVSGKSLEEFTQENIYRPLEMSSTYFHLPTELQSRCARTLSNRKCVVHDPIAYRFTPTETGHAGVFSTAEDLSHLVSMYLNEGSYKGVQILKPETVHKMTQIQETQERGLGWDLLSVYASAPRGEVFPEGISFGHTGYTGTTIWIDPKSESYLIFLSNRVFLGESQTAKRFTQLRRDLSTAIGKQFYSQN